jgi:pimeloyl-[acyl-carrier protein] methyl ester esterase
MTILVVLPGLDGTTGLRSDFSDAVRATFDSIAVIAYPSDQALDYDALERLVRAQLPATTPFVLLGESFSGPIALSIAADPPSNLQWIVLSASFAESPVRLLTPFAPFVRFAPAHTLPLPLLSWWLLGRWATPPLEAMLQKALLTVAPEVLRTRAGVALRVNALGICRSIHLPVLYLRGTNDRLLSRHAGRKIREAIARCTIKDIPGPHLLLQASPVACAHAIGEFASQQGR